MGVLRSRRFIDEADLCLLVLDASQPITDEDRTLWNDIKFKKHIVVLNKIDLPLYNNAKILNQISPISGIVSLSSLSSEGINELKEYIVTKFTSADELGGSYAVTARQVNGIQNAVSALLSAKSALESTIGDDVAVSCIADARSNLAEVIGIDPTEDLIERIFGDFCVGK